MMNKLTTLITAVFILALGIGQAACSHYDQNGNRVVSIKDTWVDRKGEEHIRETIRVYHRDTGRLLNERHLKDNEIVQRRYEVCIEVNNEGQDAPGPRRASIRVDRATPYGSKKMTHSVKFGPGKNKACFEKILPRGGSPMDYAKSIRKLTASVLLEDGKIINGLDVEIGDTINNSNNDGGYANKHIDGVINLIIDLESTSKRGFSLNRFRTEIAKKAVAASLDALLWRYQGPSLRNTESPGSSDSLLKPRREESPGLGEKGENTRADRAG